MKITCPNYDLHGVDTSDLLNDYLMMHEDFGVDDADVKAYGAELVSRGVDVTYTNYRIFKKAVTGLFGYEYIAK